jgi:hypothetical protein
VSNTTTILSAIDEIIEISYKYTNRPLELFEKKHKKPPIVKLSSSMMRINVITSDKDEICFPFFKRTDIERLQKMNDFILFAEHEEILYVFIIELKTGSGNGAMSQMEAGKLFAEFIIKTAERICKQKLSCDIQYRGLIFSKKGFTQTIKPKWDIHNDLHYLHLKYMESSIKLNSYLKLER